MNQILILLAVCIVGSYAHFQCVYRLNQTSSSSGSRKSCGKNKQPTTQTSTGEKMPKLEQMLELKGLLSLEGLCFDMCNNCDGPGTSEHSDKLVQGLLKGVAGNAASQGIVGDALDVTAPLNCVAAYGLKVTRYQACTIMCMANLTVLDKCQVQAVAAKLQALCPNLESKGLCVSACLCCGNANESKDKCVELCASRQEGQGKARIPVIGDLPAQNLLKQGTLAGIAGKQGAPGVGLNLDSKNGKNTNQGGNDDGSGSSGTGASGAAGGAGGAVSGLTDTVGSLAGGLGLGGSAGGVGGGVGGGLGRRRR